MRQFLVHAHDPGTGQFLPVYRVCVTSDGTALVRAVQDGWEKSAEGLEARLNEPRHTVGAPAQLHLLAALRQKGGRA